MKLFLKGLLAFFLFGYVLFAQDYQGPESGFSGKGKIISTDDFTNAVTITPAQFKLITHKSPKPVPDTFNPDLPIAPEGSNFIKDNHYGNIEATSSDSVILFKDFQVFTHQNSIPPDPYVAAGPEHLIFVVNSYFRITDKKGNTLKTIDADKWCSKLLPGASVFDPKIIYDHFAKRWVMVWLYANDNSSESYYFLSVSDDDNPLGTWYAWALPSNVNGSTPNGSWGDYEGVGFDDKAIYLTSNQFTFSEGRYQGTKVRIIPKNYIYGDSAGVVKFTDLWEIKYPGTTYGTFGLRPVRMYSVEDSYFLVNISPYVTGTRMVVYELVDPLGTPSLIGYKIPVTSYTSPPNADQLGGGTPLIEAGGSKIRNEPVYKNGIIYLAHSVQVKNNGTYSGVHFVALDVFGLSAKIDFVFGAPQHYHFYPALALDAKNDVFITYSRSSKQEYAGAYFTVVPAGESVPTNSFTIQSGKANYVVTYGGSRNRWGDYNGAWQDPADSTVVWMFSEYVYQTNKWGTWAAGARFEPFDQAFIFAMQKSIDFGACEIGEGSVEKKIVIKNYGKQPLTVNSISLAESQIALQYPSLPQTLNAYDSIVVNLTFTPSTPAFIDDSVKIASDDPQNPVIYVYVKGRAFEVKPAAENVFYACTTLPTRSSEWLTLDTKTGVAEKIGDVEFSNVSSLTVNPTDGVILGLIKTAETSQILRINAEAGDGHLLHEFPFVLSAISFGKDGLYGVAPTKKFYKITSDWDTVCVGNLDFLPMTLAYNPVSGEFWATTKSGMRSGDLYKFNPNDLTSTKIASMDVLVNDLAFDDSGDLFAVYGTSTSFGVVDTTTGIVSEIGATGKTRVKGLVIKGDVTVSGIEEKGEENLPLTFALSQNYPNPFGKGLAVSSDKTNIRFQVPVASQVKIVVYNLLGQKVKTLVNGAFGTGSYGVDLSSSDLSSGAYFYKMTAKAKDGKVFTQVKKMIVIK